MKSAPRPLPLLLLLLACALPVRAQTGDSLAPETPPPGSTIVNADELHADQVSHTAIFTGNVIVTGTNFNMTCEEMTIIFTKENKIDNIVAKGNVVITQPDRITHSGQAQYFQDEDKIVLTDQPTILDNKNQIWAPVITIFRTKQSMFTTGRTKTLLVNGMGSANATTPSPTDAK